LDSPGKTSKNGTGTNYRSGTRLLRLLLLAKADYFFE